MSLTTWTLPRESKEWVGPVTVTVSGTPVTTFTLAILPKGTRPASGDWATPYALDGGLGLLVGPGSTLVLPVGVHRVWAKITDAPEIPVAEVGTVIIT